MKRILSLLSVAASTFTLQAQEITYSQHNPANQNEYRNQEDDDYSYYGEEKNNPELNKRHNLIFSADLLYGKISPSPITALTESISDVRESLQYSSNAKFGFRVGAGVSLQNMFNISLLYTWLQTKGSQSKTSAISSGDEINFYFLNDASVGQVAGNTYSSATYKRSEKLTRQNLDLLLQTAVWKMNDSLRFQPFGGMRFFYYQRKLAASIDASSQQQSLSLFTNGQLKIHATGVLAGSDIKYLFLKDWYFFTSGYVGILAGYVQYKAMGASQNIETNSSNRTAVNLMPFADLRFRLAWEHVSRNFLLAFRLGYEVSSLNHSAANTALFASPTRFSETSILTKALFFGGTILF